MQCYAVADRHVNRPTKIKRQLSEAGAQRAEAAAAEAAEEAGKVMRLEVALAECRQALARSAELEKEVERYRCTSTKLAMLCQRKSIVL